MLRSLCIFIILEYSFAMRQKDVRIDTGLVRGYLDNDGYGEYYAYRGIPYASQPKQKSRYRAPLPRASWDGILLANYTVECPQGTSNNEDCLIVNVFTPARTSKTLVPVLVYIHGGSFMVLSGPTRGVGLLIKENIIVVTINYRLGVIGFLCLGIDEAPGNAGLKDQTAALTWVKRNIQNFGGDPSQVTLYGVSAGGASADLHVLSEMSKGLFQRVIVESGSALPVWVTDADPIQTAFDFAETHLQLSRQITNNPHSLVHYLQHEAARKLSSTQDYFNKLINGRFGFSPCVEKQLNGTETFVSESPHEILAKQEYTKVPMVFIFTTLEGLIFKKFKYHDKKQKMEEKFTDFLPTDLVFESDEIKQEVGKIIKRFYFGNKSIQDDDINHAIGYFEYLGDYHFLHGILNSAEMHARGDNPVFLMEFAFNNRDKWKVTGHIDFVKHVFDDWLPDSRDQSQRTVAERVNKLIANFVRFGNPTPVSTKLLPVKWPQVQPGNVSYLRMDQEFTVHRLDGSRFGDRKKFWDNLYKKYRRRIKPVDPTLLPYL